MGKIEKRDNDILVLRNKYERDKVLMASHGVDLK